MYIQLYLYNIFYVRFYNTHIKSKIRNIAIRIFGDGVHEKEELDILVVG